MEITEKEFAVIRVIDNEYLPDQRTIAVRAGISLGLTNLLIKRLISRGYIKAHQLNQKKIQYLLTPKGFSEKAKKSYDYTLKTVGLIRSIKHRLNELVIEHHKEGTVQYRISGDNDELLEVMEMIFKNLASLPITYQIERTKNSGHALHLICKDKNGKNETKIDLVEYLSNTGMFWQ